MADLESPAPQATEGGDSTLLNGDAKGGDSTLLNGEVKDVTDTDVKAEGGDASVEKAEGSEGAESEFEISLPEGYELPESTLEDFKALAKETNIKGEQAQKFVDLHTKIMQSQLEAYTIQRKEWVESLKRDPEFGGNKFSANVERANRVIARFGDADLKEVLKSTGLGDNPALVKFMAKVESVMSEDAGGGGAKSVAVPKKSAADLIFDKT